ncbi:AI-2 transport protein TqsA [Yoonia vestfoldensis]|uniref:AI-2 transport protein TqsA n=1 Tax=Yoonia vestfoldensis TaxID=245188 RepID=A0A1Y0E937_9RHOB|nr:AI-2 transport protein TqsA [Yoonia vestfoldensis]
MDTATIEDVTAATARAGNGPVVLTDRLGKQTGQTDWAGMDTLDNIRTTNRLLAAMVTLMTLAALYFAKDIVLPVVLGVLLALTLGPWVRWLSQRGIPPSLAASVTILGLVALIAAGVTLLGGSVASWFDDIPRITFELRSKLRGFSESVLAFQDATKQVGEIAQGGAEDVDTVVMQQPGLLTTAVGNLTSFVTSLVVGLILALFLLAAGNMFYIKVVESFSRFGDKKRALTVIHEIERRMSRYLVAITFINAALGAGIAGVLFLLDMPFPFVWGVAAFCLNYLPFLGGIIGTLGVGAFAIVHFDSVYYALLAPLAYQALTAIEGQFVTPWFLGVRLQLNIVAVFLSVIFWTWLWGIPGALLAVPILVLIKVICDHVPTLATFGNFLSGRTDTPSTTDLATKDPTLAR